jgi:hypothetical protein
MRCRKRQRAGRSWANSGQTPKVDRAVPREAGRRRWRNWARLYISGMGISYVLLLIAFYVDNGKQLPVWKDLFHRTYWLLPLAVGIPLIVRALLWHPLARQTSSP